MVGLGLDCRGPEVEYVQSILCKIGEYTGCIHGLYDQRTVESIKRFQNKNVLPETGYIDLATKEALIPYMKGYIEYKVKQNDTFSIIAKKYETSTLRVMSANLNFNPFMLEVDKIITIPFEYQCTNDDISYTYEVLENNISGLQKRYPFLGVSIIGKSVEDRNIYALKFGRGRRKIFLNAGTHASEWITVPLLMKWIEEVCYLYTCKGMVYGRYIEDLFEYSTVHIVPMVNPDGIELQIKGLLPTQPKYSQIIKWNNGEKDFRRWKANIRGVDLNRNYNAKWEEYKEIEKEIGIKGPWFELYGGEYPESEPEVRAVADYTRQEKFDMVLSYHTQGRVIYWDFEGYSCEYAKRMAKKLAKVSKYCLDVPGKNASYAGYKDWFIKEYQKPGYTIECGLGENPIPISQFGEIYNENFELLFIAAWCEVDHCQ